MKQNKKRWDFIITFMVVVFVGTGLINNIPAMFWLGVVMGVIHIGAGVLMLR